MLSKIKEAMSKEGTMSLLGLVLKDGKKEEGLEGDSLLGTGIENIEGKNRISKSSTPFQSALNSYHNPTLNSNSMKLGLRLVTAKLLSIS